MSKTINRCRGTNARGVACNSPFVGADGYCTAHREGGTVEMRRRGLKGAIAARKAAVRGLDPEELGSL